MTERGPLADHALLSNGSSAALVNGAGSVEWFCSPRFDSPSVFARILDPQAGHWQITPREECDTTRRYLLDSLVLSTRFASPAGIATVTDALAVAPDQLGHAVGLDAPAVLLRVVEGFDGVVEIDAELAPRPAYGREVPAFEREGSVLVARAETSVLAFAGPPPTEVGEGVTRWRFGVRPGDRVAFALQVAPVGEVHLLAWTPEEIAARLDSTLDAWQSWSEVHRHYRGPWQELVGHSGRVLHGLTYRPTGAVVVAPTTSLPEQALEASAPDDRYASVRDASATSRALRLATCDEEANRFLGWLVETIERDPDHRGGAAAVYGVGGEHDLGPWELRHLDSWEGGGTIRVGSELAGARAVEVHGELLDAVALVPGPLDDLPAVAGSLLVDLADQTASGWERRGSAVSDGGVAAPTLLSSALLSWVALDRAIPLAERLRVRGRRSAWVDCRERISQEICHRGWNPEVGAFTQAFGTDVVDASALLLVLTGFLPPEDPRMRATVGVIAERLSAPCGLLYRWSSRDGIGHEEVTSLQCTFWLVEVLARSGEVRRARQLFEGATAYANDVGLLSEGADPYSGTLLGNFPSTRSHAGLVNAAHAIGAAEGAEAMAVSARRARTG